MVFLCITFNALAQSKQDEAWTCIRWRWSSDDTFKRAVCIEWKKKDCSKRLYKEICKKE